MVNKFFYNLNTNPSNGGIDAQPAQNDQPSQTTSLENSSDPALNHEQIEQANATNLTECQPNLAGVRTSSDRVASGYPDGLRHRNIPPSKIERTEHQAEVKCNKTVTATREKRKMI